MDAFKRAGGEAVVGAIDELPAGMRKDAIVDQQQITAGKLDEIGLGDVLSAKNRSGPSQVRPWSCEKKSVIWMSLGVSSRTVARIGRSVP